VVTSAKDLLASTHASRTYLHHGKHHRHALHRRHQRIRHPHHPTQNGTYEGFSKTYGCTRRLYSEKYDDIRTAIAREKQLKGWRLQKKLDLIRTTNPDFKDLAEKLGWKFITQHERMKS
jgi:predicted GIY-YIG superfamily endonuclease